MSSNKLNITFECSSGAELLFGGIKKHELSLEKDRTWTMGELLKWLCTNKLTDKLDMFMQRDSVRPGLLVLINEIDWELLAETDYKLEDNDNVLLISTLHGG